MVNDAAHALRRIACGGLLAVGLLSVACSPTDSDTLPEENHRFVDRAVQLGIDHVTTCGNPDKRYLLETIGSGVAVADYDNDGDLDLYFGTAQSRDDWNAGRRVRANALYRNDGEGSFTEVGEAAGVALKAWTSGVYFVDYDNDGDKDHLVSEDEKVATTTTPAAPARERTPIEPAGTAAPSITAPAPELTAGPQSAPTPPPPPVSHESVAETARETVAETAPAAPAQPSLTNLEPAVQSETASDDDMLEIPAFLRRQAN